MKVRSKLDYKKLRKEMVEKAIFARGVRSNWFSMPCVACRVRTSCQRSFASLLTTMRPCRSKKGRRSRSPISSHS